MDKLINDNRYVEIASDNGPESITTLRLREKYTFFTKSDVKTYFYKKRTMSSIDFSEYIRKIDIIERVYRSANCVDINPKGRSLINSILKSSESYKQNFSKNRVEPQGALDFFKSLSDPTGLKALSEQIPDVLDTIGEKLPDSTERKEFMGLFKTFQDKIPDFYLPSSGETLKKATSLLNGLSNLSPSILIVIASAWYAHSRSWSSLAFFVASAAYFIIKVPDQLFMLFKVYVSTFEKVPFFTEVEMEQVSPQMSDDTLELVGTSIATILIGMVGIKSKMTGAALALTFVKNFSSAKSGMTEIAKLILKFVEKLVNHFREECLDLPSIKFVNSCSKEIDSFSQEVRLYSFKFNKRTIERNESTYSNLLALLDVGKQLLKSIPRDKFTDSTIRGIHEDCSSIKKIIIDFEREDINLRGTRQEPCAVLLSGGPGVAKSVAGLYYTYIVTRSVLTDEEKKEFDQNPGSFIFSRKLENVFFDSLTNKAKTFFYDDFMQLRDVPGASSEAMEIIRVVNTEEYNAHMAHLENKGNVYVRPKFVIATTNQTNLKTNSIINIDAMKRRFDLAYVVVPKPEFVRDEDFGKDLWHRRLDHSKLPLATIIDPEDAFVRGHEVTDLRPDCLLFYEHDLINGTYGEPIEFEEVIRRAKNVELVKRRQFALHTENFKGLIKKYEKIFETESEPEVLSPDYSFDPSIDEEDEDSEISEYLVDSITATIDQRSHLEYLIIVDPVYRSYLQGLLGPCGCTTIEEIIDVLLDRLGYAHTVRLLNSREKVPDGSIFLPHKNKKRFLAIRILKPIENVVNYFLSFIPSYQTIKSLIVEDEEPLLLLLGIIASSAIMVMIGKWFYSWWTGKPAPDPQSFGFSDKMREPKKGKAHFKNSDAIKAFINQNAPVNVTPQSGEDSSGVDLINSFVRKNCFKVECLTDKGEWNVIGSLTVVSGRIALMAYHFIPKWMNGIIQDRKRLKNLIRLSHGSDASNPGLLFTIEEFLNGHQTGCLHGKDAVLVELPRRFPERPSIIDRFALRKDIEHTTRNVEVLIPNVSTTFGFYHGRAQKNKDNLRIYDKIPGYDYEIRETYCYDIPTKSGDCGNLMCVLNSSIPKRKIFGMHVAGNTYHGTGYASIITQEEIIADMKLFSDPIVSEMIEVVEPQSGDFDVPLRFEIIGRVKNAPMRNTNSAIRRSKMYGLLGTPELDRAMLRSTVVDGTLVDPLMNAHSKYCKPDIWIDPEIIMKCTRSYFEFCEWQEVYPVDRVVYSVEESIYGLEYDYDFSSVNSSASAGYPMNVLGERNLKKELFSYEQGSFEQKAIFEEVSELVKEVIDKAKKGVRTFVVFTDFLKDELRKLEKVLQGSTRLVSGAPFIYFIAFRMYFGAFSLWYMKNRINNGSAIGVNPYSSEWNTIANKLIEISPSNIGAGDEEKYDGSQKPIIHLEILDSVNRWYGGDATDNMIRSILWMEVYNSKHIVDGIIYEWFSSLPSGHPFTIIINTIYHHVITRFVWYKAVGNLADYNNNVYVIVLGDDILYSVTDPFTELFNDVVFAKHALELGMVYTIESKTGELVARRHITEIEFLKRTFVYDPAENLFIAPLKLTSILKMLDWTKNKHKNAIVASNVITAARELSLHSTALYDKYVPKINDNFKNCYPGLFTSEPILMDQTERRTKVLGTVAFY
jgi:hypothetical protein